MVEEGPGPPFTATSGSRRRGACDIRSRPHRTSHKGHTIRRQILWRNAYIQITEIEGHVKTLSYKQSLPSTQDSIKTIAAPQDEHFDDEQIRALLASPRYVPEREARAERPQVYHSEREGLMSSSPQGLNFTGTGESVALFFTLEKVESRRVFREEATC